MRTRRCVAPSFTDFPSTLGSVDVAYWRASRSQTGNFSGARSVPDCRAHHTSPGARTLTGSDGSSSVTHGPTAAPGVRIAQRLMWSRLRHPRAFEAMTCRCGARRCLSTSGQPPPRGADPGLFVHHRDPSSATICAGYRRRSSVASSPSRRACAGAPPPACLDRCLSRSPWWSSPVMVSRSVPDRFSSSRHIGSLHAAGAHTSPSMYAVRVMRESPCVEPLYAAGEAMNPTTPLLAARAPRRRGSHRPQPMTATLMTLATGRDGRVR